MVYVSTFFSLFNLIFFDFILTENTERIDKEKIKACFYTELYTFQNVDRTVTIPRKEFPEIQDSNRIVFCNATVADINYDAKAIWDNGVILVLNATGSNTSKDSNVSICVLYI